MQAQTEPQTSLCLSSSRFTWAGSMWDGSSTGISMVSNPQRLNCGKSLVLSLVKGDVKRKVLMPMRIRELRVNRSVGVSKRIREGCVMRIAYWVCGQKEPKSLPLLYDFLYRRGRGGWIKLDWL